MSLILKGNQWRTARVAHVDYPNTAGRIVGRVKTWPAAGYIYLVKWDDGSQSRHIGNALISFNR